MSQKKPKKNTAKNTKGVDLTGEVDHFELKATTLPKDEEKIDSSDETESVESSSDHPPKDRNTLIQTVSGIAMVLGIILGVIYVLYIKQ